MKTLYESLAQQFAVSDFRQRRSDQAFLTVRKEHAPPLLTHLRDYRGFTRLSFLTAVDFMERGVFQLTYMLNHPTDHRDLGIHVEIDRKEPEMISVHPLWEQVKTYQRELKEMFGIDFPGSPGVDDSFILEGWEEKPPMRRDFDTRAYSEKTYFPAPGRETHDPREHMKKKLYPEGDSGKKGGGG